MVNPLLREERRGGDAVDGEAKPFALLSQLLFVAFEARQGVVHERKSRWGVLGRE